MAPVHQTKAMLDLALTLRSAIILVGRRCPSTVGRERAARVRLEPQVIFRPLPDQSETELDPRPVATVALLGGYRRFI